MIDAEVPGDARADGVLALDVAARRHHEVVGEQGLADFAVAVGAACAAEQGAVLFPGAELVRRDEAAFPQSLAILLGAGLVGLEAAAGGGFDIEAESAADDHLAQARRLAFDLAGAEAPLLVGGIHAEIVAAHLLAAGQLRQLIARLDAAGPDVGVLVDAELVERRRVDAVEPVGDIADLKRAAIPHDGGGGRTLAGRKNDR